MERPSGTEVNTRETQSWHGRSDEPSLLPPAMMVGRISRELVPGREAGTVGYCTCDDAAAADVAVADRSGGGAVDGCANLW